MWVTGVQTCALPIYDLIDSIVSNAVSTVVNPLITQVNNTLLVPLSNLLGLELGGADVFAVPRPNCTVPKLVG